MLTLLPLPAARMPATLASARDDILRYAHDHTDTAEHMQAIRIAADAATRIREIAATCARPEPLNEMAELIEASASPVESEAYAWDEERDARAWGDRLDQRRAIAAE